MIVIIVLGTPYGLSYDDYEDYYNYDVNDNNIDNIVMIPQFITQPLNMVRKTSWNMHVLQRIFTLKYIFKIENKKFVFISQD